MNREIKRTNRVSFGTVLDKTGILAVLIVMCIALTIATPKFIGSQNLSNILRQIMPIALIAYGETQIIIMNGIDLSPGSTVCLVSVIFGLCVNLGMPVIFIFLIALAVGAFVGLINGSIIAGTGMPPFIVTLFTYTSIRGVALVISNGQAIHLVEPERVLFYGQGMVLGIPFPVIVLVVITILIQLIMSFTRYGKHVYATGGNEQAAIISGINVKGLKVIVYTFAGLLAGIASFLLTARVQSGQPSIGVGFELDAIAAAVIGGASLSGGIGTIYGAFIGALVIGVMNNGMTMLYINSNWQTVAKGLIIVGAVYLDFVRRRLRESIK